MLPLAFLHVAKTGGTTVADIVTKFWLLSDQFVPQSPEHFVQEAPLEAERPLIRGHFHYFDGLKYGETFHGMSRLFFTVVRSPEAHLMSLIWARISHARNMVRGREHSPFEEKIFSEELERAVENLGDDEIAQYRYFLDDRMRHDVLSMSDIRPAISQIQQSIAGIGVVGTTERIRQAIQLLCWRMEWPAERDLGKARYSGAGREALPSHIKKRLSRRIQLDAALYEAAESRLDRDYASLIEAAGSRDVDDYLDAKARYWPV